jgi:hypothetical protein
MRKMEKRKMEKRKMEKRNDKEARSLPELSSTV